MHASSNGIKSILILLPVFAVVRQPHTGEQVSFPLALYRQGIRSRSFYLRSLAQRLTTEGPLLHVHCCAKGLGWMFVCERNIFNRMFGADVLL